MKAPLGSGPYKVGRVVAGQTIEYERVADYWGKDLPVNRGLYNFDRIRIEFYRDRQAAFEAFKKGDILYRQEFTSRIWATGYDFPAIKAGKVIKREFPGEKRPSMQAIAVNQRRERFRDVRVRQAIGMCFDFEWTSRNLFYGSLRALAVLLRELRLQGGRHALAGGACAARAAARQGSRRGLRRSRHAARHQTARAATASCSARPRSCLPRPAGSARATCSSTTEGERLTVEFLVDDEAFVRIFSPWIENMKAIGIDASIRLVDSAQYQAPASRFRLRPDLAWRCPLRPRRPATTSTNMFHSRSANLTARTTCPAPPTRPSTR